MMEQSITVRIGADISALTAGIRDASQQMRNLSSTMETAFSSIGTIGKALTGIGVAGVAGLGAAVNVAADFDTQMRKAGAIAGATTDELANIRTLRLISEPQHRKVLAK